MIKRFLMIGCLGAIALAFLLNIETLALGAPAPKKTNVLFLVLDQLQADRLHCYGNLRDTSPNIDRLAQGGARFSHFFTVGPWTVPSFASLHTSLYPSRHGVTLLYDPEKPGIPLIDKDTPMLAPTFQLHGYDTAAFVNNPLAGQALTGRGFDEYDQISLATAVNITERAGGDRYSGPSTTERVLSWLDRHKSQPFFLYVHLYEPHSPYDPPPEDDIFKSDAYPFLFDTGYDVAHSPLKRLAMLGDEIAAERLYQLYDGKIHFVDRYVGKILDHLRELGLADTTLVVLTSDHGELLYSHPRDFQTFDHRSLYDKVMHVPLIVAGPHVPEGRVIDGLASNIDTAPTVLDLVGLPPLSGAQGRSLVPLIEGKSQSQVQSTYGEEDIDIPQRSVRTLHHKLIRNLWTGKDELFDLDRDPGELNDISREKPQVLKDLQAQLDQWLKENEPSKEIQLRRWRIYGAGGGIVDDQSIGIQFQIHGGGWHSDTEPRSGNYQQGCFWTESGDGSRTALWQTDNPMLGTYKISVYFGHPSVGRLASDAPFTVVTDEGSKTVLVNFIKEAGGWHVLGTFHNPRYVSLANAADGAVIADAVEFIQVSPE